LIIYRQKKAAHIPENWEVHGIHLPPSMTARVTGKCNLNYPGCYAHARQRSAYPEIILGRIKSIVIEQSL
jgi:MoaA/NifB/PqqE/SkfB family radical SAM enzyme